MHWRFPSAVKSMLPGTALIWAFSGGLLGYYYQIHRVFLAGTSSHIPVRTVKGFLLGGALGLLLWISLKIFAGSGLREGLKKGLSAFAQAVLFAALAYMSYILYQNTGKILGFPLILLDVLKVYPAFAALTLITALILRLAKRGSLAASSLVAFLLFASYMLIKTGSVAGFGISVVYHFYLMLLGRFAAGGLSRLVGSHFDSALDTLLVSYFCGILCNHVVWFILGHLSLLYSATVYLVVLPVMVAGLIRYGRSLFRHAGAAIAADDSLLSKRTDPVTAVLLNVTLFCLLLLVAVLTIKFPGSGDSSARMYCATIYKFAEMHGIVFPPLFHHWPLLFQPLLMEMSGLPPYLAGGITAVRFFNGTVYFSFIPAVLLLCSKYRLPFRTLVIFVLVFVSSSFSLSLAYYDKPSVIAFPAFISLLCVCLVMMKETKLLYILAVGVLTAIIYNTKLVLLSGAFAAILLLCIHRLFRKPHPRVPNFRKAVAVSAGIFLVACSLHAIQNISLRGNPFHPFAAGVFKASRDYPEELKFSEIPAHFYERTIPTAKLTLISTVNLDSSRPMYRPYIKNYFRPQDSLYFVTQTSVNITVLLTAVLLPFFLLIRSDKLLVFCTVMAVISFFVWFGWVGDGWRYSTVFPCLALLGAVLAGKQFLPNRFLDFAWRYVFYGLLVFSVPVGLYYTANTPAAKHMIHFLMNRLEEQESFQPEIEMMTTHLRELDDIKPVLLVSDMEVGQYGLFQPNFIYQPLHWREELFTNMVYLSVIRPTHLLVSGKLQYSDLIEHYPFLEEHLELEKVVHIPKIHLELYRFDEQTPWDEYHDEFIQKETFIPGHIEGIRRVLDRYRS